MSGLRLRSVGGQTLDVKTYARDIKGNWKWGIEQGWKNGRIDPFQKNEMKIRKEGEYIYLYINEILTGEIVLPPNTDVKIGISGFGFDDTLGYKKFDAFKLKIFN